MIWNTARRLGTWLRTPADAKDVRDQNAEPSVVVAADDAHSEAGIIVNVRKLRRRLLSRKGAQMLVHMVERQDAGMLAILDANGVVVYWHDGMAGKDAVAKNVLDRHVAQFYAPKKQSQLLARDHLCKAFSRGSSSEFGWRCRPDGTVFWGMTVIEPLVLRDGRLQGFAHITRAVNEPRKHVVRIQHETTGVWGDVPALRCVNSLARTAAVFRPAARFAHPQALYA